MAVTITAQRSDVLKGTNSTGEVGAAALTGTYVTGGFTYPLTSLTGGSGTSPFGGKPISIAWQSPKGYIYVSTFAGQLMTTKIFSAANTELANATAVPDASVPFILTRSIAI